ncbi:receptor-type tyrosine-protein phosphatase mu-like isoform X6 [Apostichopus japonicus]|uniref:receptor-type tyrosine-protein phosphatase mu-like isoform X6 n=1 Tax=Stichopus japonicus TaxID=307972 RepID=UPI003AB154EA
MANSVPGGGITTLRTGTLIVFLFLLNFSSTIVQCDPSYVAVVRSPVATTTNPTIIEVHRGDSQTTSITFDKAVLFNPGGIGNQRYMFTLNSPRVPDEAMTNISSEPATLTLPTTMETAARTGIYTITVTEGESSVEWRVLVTNEAATTKALEYSTGASMGDKVTVLIESSVAKKDLRWRRDGVWDPDGSTGSRCWGETSCGDASASNSVVFECHKFGAYTNQVHAIMNVIVRACPENMWSLPGCSNTCEPCINGGVCSDLTGLCLCPPGFSGNNCEHIHGRNVFGQNAEYKCDDSGDDHADGCQGAIICYPDPLGCFCPAGYKGLDCTLTCERGKFGANCKQECHCADNSLCALDTGVCQNNQCEDGWTGINCQFNCPVGFYGVVCNLPCSCPSGEDGCSEVEANCANGCAVPWTGIACDQDNGAGNISLTYVRVNSGQTANVTCTVIRNPLVAQSDLVLSPTGTLLTADEDARSYNQTKVVGITLEAGTEVTCSISSTQLMETINLIPYVPPVYVNLSNVLVFTDVTSTSITVSWPPWDDKMDPGDGPIIDYRIQYQQKGADNFMKIKRGLNLSHQLTGLQMDTLYEFKIILVREGQGGEGAPSNIQRQRTLCQVPFPQGNVTVTDKAETSLTIEWDDLISVCSEAVTFQLQYRPIEKLYDQQFVVSGFGPQVEIANNGANNVYQLTDLEPSTVYEIQLNAQTSVGQKEVVSITERTNLFTGLEPPTVPPVITQDGTSATLILPALNQKYASSYYIRVQLNSLTRQQRDVDGFRSFHQNPDEYIAAEVEKRDEDQMLTVGDGEMYGIYLNAPLKEGESYDVFIGTGGQAGEDVVVVWSDPIPIVMSSTQAAFLIPTVTILVVVLLAVVVIGIILVLCIHRRKKSEPGATSTPDPAQDLARNIPLKPQGSKKDDIGSDAYEEPNQKQSFSASAISGNYTEPHESTEQPDVEYQISKYERKSESYDDVEIENQSGIIGSVNEYEEPRHFDKPTLYSNDLGNPNILNRGHLPFVDTPQHGRSLHVEECYEELPGTAESKNVAACKVKIKDLPKQLQDKNSVPEDTITDEFKKLPCGQQHPWTVGILKDESPNSGILPYDHSRVKLHKDSSGSDIGYLNANYIKVQHPQLFIATQDPTERTTELFWKMVWLEKVEVIINLSQPKMSSSQYWPVSEGTIKINGDYTLIWYKSYMKDVDLLIREIKIVKGDKLHEVKLCHFLSWSDESIPPQSVSFINFIRKVKDLKTTRSHPLLVHCNNGVGATGTFIALYCLMDDLKDSKKTGLSVSSLVNRMRKDRVNMIENELQYCFLYECLVVDLLAPNKAEPDKSKDEITEEFKMLEYCRGFSVWRSSIAGHQRENAAKNRCPSVVPYDFARAILKTPGTFQGFTDYINACVINSCYSKDAFIMTQSPLPTTAEDFWRMVYDYDCAAIVCLNEMDENDETTCFYWPDSGKIQHGNMLVECTHVEDKDKNCSQRKLIVKSKKTKRVVTVDHYQLIEWSQDSDQTDGIIELIGKIKPITEEKKTIVVHCMDGASRCGVFVSILLEISRIKRSKTGRFFETVLKLTGQNPHVMKSLDDYLLCHQLVKAALVEDESKYQEVK